MNENSINKHKEANEIINNYVKNRSDYLYIHYARQNFFDDAYEKGPRTIAIAVMNARSEQTMVFSLKKSAEKLGYSFFDATVAQQDDAERELLKTFYEYVEGNHEKIWLHWNMKNNNFGFSAIEKRYRELGGEPYKFEEGKLINISALLKDKYGMNMAHDTVWKGKVVGKLYDLLLLNNLDDPNILNGEEEVKEYILGNLMLIEQSTLGKVKAIKIILEKSADGALKTRGNILVDVYGLSIRGIAQYVHENGLLAMVFAIIGGVISALICRILGI